MMKYPIALLAFVLPISVFAQFNGFESGIPQSFTTSPASELSISDTYYKEGEQSLKWDFTPGAQLNIAIDPLTLDEQQAQNYGIYLWMYNERPQQDSLRFEFLDHKGDVARWFTYKLKAAGWRACWIGFEHMRGDKSNNQIAAYRIVAPQRKGSVWLDRITFPVTKVNQRTTPDEQMPYNNSMSYRDLWHWCRVWQWEQYAYDLLPHKKLTKAQKEDLRTVEQRVEEYVQNDKLPKAETTQVKKAYAIFKKANIRRVGSGFSGAPIVAPDELNRKKGELSWNDIEAMLAGFAYDAYYNHSKKAAENYFTVFEYAMNQGFAFGSGMGTNHHYGYQVRKIYTTAWLMRHAIYKHKKCDDILRTLQFWAALQETRQPYKYGRDELLDTWHTLLMAKTISALMMPDECQRERALRSLSRWVSTSLSYTPGTIGGIKIDGTTFHHGGFYPAYTTGALATLGQYVGFTNNTSFAVDKAGRNVLESALMAMRNYSNLHEWSTGIGGRHPFGGSMKANDVAAVGYLALADSTEGKPFNVALAADYLRLNHGETNNLSTYFTQQGVLPAAAPQGFFVYNYGCTGIFRRNNWMVTLKGYNTDVWGSEIYVRDNRYGRYQSYGSVQIMGKGTPVSRAGSGFVIDGWDWNRLPGTTTIHLPFELLDSPLPGTTMAHSSENFAGASSLQGKNGVFAIKLMERRLKNFTPDFVARKSAFCFDNRMVCLGSNINNSNEQYPTETTLYQTEYRGGDTLSVDGAWLCDGYDNYYRVAEGTVKHQVAKQQSLHEKSRKPTEGIFSSAWIDHGKAPRNGTYQYMVLIQPTAEELKLQTPENCYEVLQHDSVAHIVYDKPTGITAYAAFESLAPTTDKLLTAIPAETLLMWQPQEDKIVMSVCDPNLNIEEKAYTTKQPSRPIVKRLMLKGNYQLVNTVPGVQVVPGAAQTELIVHCQHGQPVEFLLEKR